MKKFLFILFGVFAFSGAFAAGENVPTSKDYVDAAVAQKQDKISASTIILPTGYTALEYLESTGTQYIDTGIAVNNNIGISIDFQYSNSSTTEQALFGHVDPNFGFWRIRSEFGYGYKDGIGTTDKFIVEASELLQRHKLEFNFYNNHEIKFDNITKQLPHTIFSSNRTLYLFAYNYGEAYAPSQSRVFFINITYGTELVRNFIPARRDSDNVVGMYDTISGQFFTNSGTGEFIAGPVGPVIPGNQVLTNTGTAGEIGAKGIYDANDKYVIQQNNLVDAVTMNTAVQNAIDSEFQCIEWLDPNDHTSDCLLLQLGGITQVPAGYTQLQYIESTGTQYIDTGYKPNNLTNFEIQYLHTGWLSSTVANIPYGCTNNPDVGRANNGLFRTNRGGNDILYNRVAWGNTNADTNIDLPNQFLAELNEWYTDKYLQNKIYINGTLVATSNAPTDISWNSSRTMYLFRRNSISPMPSKIRISYAKIWENESVIKNFIPARRDSDGVLGMYDTVSNTFFTNNGTGEFIAGPMVYLPTGE